MDKNRRAPTVNGQPVNVYDLKVERDRSDLSLGQQIAVYRSSSPFAQCGAAATEEMGVRPIVDAEVEVDSSACWIKRQSNRTNAFAL